jgi:hypothetical protein
MHDGGSMVNSPREQVAASQRKKEREIQTYIRNASHGGGNVPLRELQKALRVQQGCTNYSRYGGDTRPIAQREQRIEGRLFYGSISTKTDPFTYGGLGPIYCPSFKGKVPEERRSDKC